MSLKLLRRLDRAIRKHNLRASWRDGLFTKTESERDEREEQYYTSARHKFLTAMRSPKNDGSKGYSVWALNMALGLVPPRAAYRSSLNRMRAPWKEP